MITECVAYPGYLGLHSRQASGPPKGAGNKVQGARCRLTCPVLHPVTMLIDMALHWQRAASRTEALSSIGSTSASSPPGSIRDISRGFVHAVKVMPTLTVAESVGYCPIAP